MSGWQILGLVVIVLFLIGQVRVGVGAEFAQDGLTVRARLGWIKIKVFPRPKKEKEKPKKKKSPKKVKNKDKKRAEKASSVPAKKPETGSASGPSSAKAEASVTEQKAAPSAESGQDKKEKPEKPVGEKIGGALDLAKQFLPLVLEAAGCFWKKLVMDELELSLTVGGPDPADAAMLYGQANAALAALWEPITNAFHVKDGHAQVRVDFDAPQMTLYAKAALSLKIGQILWLAVYFGCRALARFLKYRSIRKAKQKDRKAV